MRGRIEIKKKTKFYLDTHKSLNIILHMFYHVTLGSGEKAVLYRERRNVRRQILLLSTWALKCDGGYWIEQHESRTKTHGAWASFLGDGV